MTAIMLMATTAAYAVAPTAEEQACFDAINQMRAKAGLPAFTLSAELSEGCRSWSATLRKKKHLEHAQSLENCACGYTDGAATFRQWYASPAHRALLLHRSAVAAGIGNDGAYWTFRIREREREREVTKTFSATNDAVTFTATKRRTSGRHCCR